MNQTATSISPSIETCEGLQTFFNTGGLLTKACDEIGLDVGRVRRNLQGKAKDIKIIYAVILLEWQRMWESQEVDRRKLSEMAPK